MMAICDGVRQSRHEPDVFELKGLRHGITAGAFPFTPDRLWLWVSFSSARAGEFPAYVRVIQDRTDRTIFYMHLRPRPSFENDGDFLIWWGPIRCRFPEAGQYTVQVWFFREQGNDVLKGEMPFYVPNEGS